MKHQRFILTFILIICTGIFASCKKNKDTPATTPNDSTSIQSKVKDSALLATRNFYLWYNQIPSNFNAQNYADPAKILQAIRQYSMEPGYNAPVDKWSFGILKTDWNQLSGGIGSINDITAIGNFGLKLVFRAEGDLRVGLVERLSPAGFAGVQRGWRITKVNGNSNITTTNITFLNNALNSANSIFTFTKPDGSSIDISLTAANYAQQPAYLDTIYNIGSKTIGYFVFNSFLGDTGKISNDLQRVINNFSSQNVSDVIVDLRYNGGGYISVQEKLADYLAPASANGNVMMKETYNDKHQNYNTTLYFRKTGPLNLNHILFIVTQSTASASELLINNLKPFMDVKLIGPSKTDGKPVGFFPISAGDWYVFPVSFRSENSLGQGGYFNGIDIDSEVADGLDKNWGDPAEASLAKAIKYITTGTFRAQAFEIYKEDPAVSAGNHLLDEPFFKGSVDTRGMK
ncbi:MAG: S41 family peptidase [Ginsengibacter sp.]